MEIITSSHFYQITEIFYQITTSVDSLSMGATMENTHKEKFFFNQEM